VVVEFRGVRFTEKEYRQGGPLVPAAAEACRNALVDVVGTLGYYDDRGYSDSDYRYCEDLRLLRRAIFGRPAKFRDAS
jgi:hypothetical protein